MKSVVLVLMSAIVLAGCGGGGSGTANMPTDPTPPGATDDTDTVQQAVDRGGIVTFEARTYHLTKTIVLRNSNTVIRGAGPATVFEYKAVHNRVHCTNDRVFTTPCTGDDVLPRQIAQPIAVGDTSFVAAADASDVQSGEWLLINDYDSVFGDRAAVDWVQVDSVNGTTVHVSAPFRMAFTTARPWIAGKSGLGFTRISPLVENIELRNFTVSVPDTGNSADRAAGISIFMAKDVTIDRVTVNNPGAQPLYTYLSKGVTITNSEGHGDATLNEFGSTVDLTICNNTFDVAHAAGFGLDLGAAFFDVCNNSVSASRNVGAYLLYGVHDGKFRGNHVGYVNADSSAAGLLVWGAQNVEVSGNTLEGGAGPDSAGISVRASDGEIPVPSVNVTLTGNIFGNGWVNDYEPGTVPN